MERFQNKASSTRRQLGSPDSHGHQPRLRVLIIANVQHSTVALSHLDVRSLRLTRTPNRQITWNPVRLVGPCCTAIPEQVQWPPLAALCLPSAEPPQSIASHQILLGYIPLQSIKCIKVSTLCATHGAQAVHSFLTSWKPQHLASFCVLAHCRSYSTCSCALIVLVICPCDGAVCRQP